MSTTMLYAKGNRNHFWKKYFAKSAIFNDEDVAAALESGEWYAHPAEVPQPGDENHNEAAPAAPESHEAAPLVQSHYQPVLAPSDAVQEQPAKAEKKTTKKAK